ncbi:MAG: Cellulose-binding domain protein [Myxococcales bacterium]|nr:Cellulose-binding domain protein [Myxococcales bacterium]
MAAPTPRRLDVFCRALALVALAGGVGCHGFVPGPSNNRGAAGGGGSGAAGIGAAGMVAAGGTSGAAGAPLAEPGDLPLPRLTRDEYLQTLRDLVAQLMPTGADQILAGVLPLTTDLPVDALVTTPSEKHGGFARIDQSEQQQYSDVPATVALALGTALTSSPARVGALLGACSQNGTVMDAACLQAFIKSFGELALRHTLGDDDVAFYAGTAATPPTLADLPKVIAVMLASPRFLYRVESGDTLVAGTIYRLDAWELAARLSYHFWGTLPDAGLRDDARSGKLLTDAGYTAAVDRLMADPRADATLRSFFEQWLWPLLELPPLDSRSGDIVYQAFAGVNLPGPMLRPHMLADVLDAASWVTAHDGTIADLLTNRLSFAKDGDLASIYGLPPWNGQGTPPTLPPARVGLLTRAAFLSTGTINSRPVMKGVFIRTTLLCDPIPPPPPNAANTPIAASANQTTREVIESVTEATGTVCVGCHKSFINPLGFASESFDGLGRERAQQTFFDDGGKVTGQKAVDTTSVPGVTNGDRTASAGMADVTRLIVASGKVEACLASRVFRYAFRRLESDGDQATLDGLTRLARTGTLRDLFKGVALRAEFRQRVIAP